jgi:para-aminobenzoate synthetase component 1
VTPSALAVVGDRLATELVDVTSDLDALDSKGFWAVVVPFDGPPVCARFARVRPARPWPGPAWPGLTGRPWRTSLDRAAYQEGVAAIRSAIADGDVYQVNLTRRLDAPLPDHDDVDIAALGAALATGNPAPFSAVIRLPRHGVHVASASPELFLRRHGDRVWSSPIKGTAPTVARLTDKDRAENVMIVDLVRNDFGRVCEYGTVEVPTLCAVERHPGLVHLVSTVTGRLRAGTGWAELLDATFPPGSITGAPKIAAIDHLRRLEPRPRDVYCGAIGWVDADRAEAELNVAIRTFWIDDGHLNFGTGGGITWYSDPEHEWEESQLKTRNLLRVAAADPAEPSNEHCRT